MSNKPTPRVTPRVWVLDSKAETYSVDRKFIENHLPRHRIVPISGQIKERMLPGTVVAEAGGAMSTQHNATPPPPPSVPSWVSVGNKIAGTKLVGTLGLFVHDGAALRGLSAAHLSNPPNPSSDVIFVQQQPLQKCSPRLGAVITGDWFFDNSQDVMGVRLDHHITPIQKVSFCLDVGQWCVDNPGAQLSATGSNSGSHTWQLDPQGSPFAAVVDFLDCQDMLIISQVVTPFGIGGESGSGLIFNSQTGPTFMEIYKGDDSDNPQLPRTLVFYSFRFN